MSNFQFDLSDVEFSAKASSKRIKKATALFGEGMIKRIVALALYFLGAKRKQISEIVDLPLGTLFTFLTRFSNRGIDALSTKRLAGKVANAAQCIGVVYKTADVESRLDFSATLTGISTTEGNSLQHKVLVLSFFKWRLISCAEAAKHLGFSERHVRDLSLKLETDDVYGLIDKRQGQQRDYAVTAEIKAELIQQFAFNAITGKATSSQQLCQQVNEACGSDITDRSLRLHINKLGLSTIKNSLCKMVDEFKKNSRD